MEFKFNFRVASGSASASEPASPGGHEGWGHEGKAQEAAAGGSQGGGPSLREHRVGSGLLAGLLGTKMAEELKLASGVPGVERLGVEHLTSPAMAMCPEGQGEPSGAARHCDRVPGLYEGGLKIWECTFDLLRYLGGLELRGRRVLDLGCGAGLLGIAALRGQAAAVHFQDYNGAVIEGLTIPNVALSEGSGGLPAGGDEPPDLEDGEDGSGRPPGKRSKDHESPGGKEGHEVQGDENRHDQPPGKRSKDEESPGGKEGHEVQGDEDRHDELPGKRSKGEKSLGGKEEHGVQDDEDGLEPPGKRKKDEESLGGKEVHGVKDVEDRHDEPPGKQSKDKSPSPPKLGLLSRCRFFSGEWSHFSKVHADDSSFKYDVILTSETLYNPDCYRALHDTLSSLLSEKGKVYLASKVHYFGVGGGIHLFESFVKENKVFEIETVKVIDDGLQRCIAVMSFKRDKCS